MKLRSKLTVFSVVLIATAVLACCFFILSFARSEVVADITESGLLDYAGFSVSLRSALQSAGEITPSIQRSFVLSAFRSIAGSQEYTLSQGDDFLSNNTGFSMESMIEKTGDGSLMHTVANVNGRDYFIAYDTLDFQDVTYALSMVRDITLIMDSVRELAAKCIAASLAVMLTAAGGMWLFVRRSLRPIGTLQAGANRLARGEYENRIHITGKDELSVLAADFNTMADAIEENIRILHETAERRQAFINDLSHELKTPVTSIMLGSETLLNRKLPQKETERTLERIYNQSRWLEGLSQRLMALVLLQGEIEKKPERVKKLLSDVKDSVSEILSQSGMLLITECNIQSLSMDIDLLRAALVNLVDNARKAGTEGQKITLRATDGIIQVIDEGKGIPADEIERITEPFYMVDRSRSKKSGGAGLGLALVRRIAEAHGATLEIESVLGQGTTVRIIFPSSQ